MKRFLQVAAVVVAVAIVIVLMRVVVSDSLVTEVVRMGVMEDAISGQGVLIKEETLYTSSTAGTFEPQVAEGARVSKGMRIGSVYQGQVDPALKMELNQINRRIETLKSSSVQGQVLSNDMGKLDGEIDEKVAEIIESAADQDMEKLSELTTAIAMLTNQKAIVRGEEGIQLDTLESLQQQKTQLESQLGAVRSDMYASGTGVFSSYLDGFEEELTPARIQGLLPSDLKPYLDAQVQVAVEASPGTPVCKVINNFLYYVAVPIDTALASDLAVGDSVQLRFRDISSDLVDCRVEYLSADEEGQTAAVFSTSQEVSGVFAKRRLATDVVKSQYKGLKLPIGAIHTEEGQQGVYAIRESSMVFIPVEITYNNDEYAIIAYDPVSTEGLRLYDEVILRADHYEDGKLIR